MIFDIAGLNPPPNLHLQNILLIITKQLTQNVNPIHANIITHWVMLQKQVFVECGGHWNCKNIGNVLLEAL